MDEGGRGEGVADAASADVARLSEATSGVGASRMSLRSCGLPIWQAGQGQEQKPGEPIQNPR
jgi:hypothetical protein